MIVEFVVVPEPCLDPDDPKMSGDDADPVLIGIVLDGIYREIQACYHTAQFNCDPAARRAYREAGDAVAAIRSHYIGHAGDANAPSPDCHGGVATVDPAVVAEFYSACVTGCGPITTRPSGVVTPSADAATAR